MSIFKRLKAVILSALFLLLMLQSIGAQGNEGRPDGADVRPTLTRPTNYCNAQGERVVKFDILNFAPFFEGDVPNSILPDHIVSERVDIVSAYTNGIRTFACYNGIQAIRHAKRMRGLYTVAGAWIEQDSYKSQQELQCLISLAQEGVVDLAVVGSEVLTWQNFTAAQIIDYVEQFKEAVPNIPVTTAVKYEAMAKEENWELIIPAVDVLFINYYPFWSGYPIQNALPVLKAEHEVMEAIAANHSKEVWISETGWPSEGDCWNGYAEASEENQEQFLRETLEWTSQNNVILNWYDAIEQPWRVGLEYCGVAGSWGFLDPRGEIKSGSERAFSALEENLTSTTSCTPQLPYVPQTRPPTPAPTDPTPPPTSSSSRGARVSSQQQHAGVAVAVASLMLFLG